MKSITAVRHTSTQAPIQPIKAPLDDALVRAFETATVNPAQFHHRKHLYIAWCYLRELSVEETIARYVLYLRKLTVALGVVRKFHATITWAYILLLDEAMRQSPEASFDELLAQHSNLTRPPAVAFSRYYSEAQLQSEEARSRFMLPVRL